VKLRINPVSLANAEQEVLAGPLTEFDGRLLGLWEMAHGLEWVALAGFVVTLAVPLRSSFGIVDGLLFALLSMALVPLLTLLAASTGRLKLAQATRLLWRWAFGLAGIAVILSMVMRQGGR
jgi:NADH-quinone oxidoreductase subunit H